MPLIHLETSINAPIERCFDLSRDIDLHMRSTEATREIAITGVTRGLIGLGEEVTWEGRAPKAHDKNHSFYPAKSLQRFTGAGAFRRFDHDHYFAAVNGGATWMRDEFNYEAPL